METIAGKLEKLDRNIWEGEVVRLGGKKTGADVSDTEYVFPDGSKCWICKLHGAFFNFGEGCCLVD